MMPKTNKFGFDAIEPTLVKRRADRSPGPMGVAVREAAENLSETTESKLEQRKQNAVEAKEYRRAQDSGLVLEEIPLSDIHMDDLPRDRLELDAVALSDEMEELKASILARGQKEPIEVYLSGDGRHQLKKGWRRFTALSQLLLETGDARFGTVIARVAKGTETRISRYIDMVEENVVREDLSFAEMAQVALTAASDDKIDENDPDLIVGRLYGSLHKMKRSYVRAFVFLLGEIGDVLRFPKDVSRNLGVDVSRAIKAGQGNLISLRKELMETQSATEQSEVLSRFLSNAKATAKNVAKDRAPREKFEFHLGGTKITARAGECRIVSNVDYSGVSKDTLEKAVLAFEDALKKG